LGGKKDIYNKIHHMLFENINQYNKAKNLLIENEGNVDKVLDLLKSDKQFENTSENDLRSKLDKLNEGLGDKILNFLGDSLGGDISKIKTVLTQMKEQELKFNKEENEIYNEFYSLLQDQKELEKNKNNPEYDSLRKDITQGMNALNTRMKELTKSHDDIFNALEAKIKDLVGDNKRKKKYFNAQRANDVLETKNDRYEKIKAITSKSSKRSSDLEKFFGVSVEDTKKDAEKAEKDAKESVEKLGGEKLLDSSKYQEEPERSLHKKAKKIIDEPGGLISKRKDLDNLENEFLGIIDSEDFKTFSDEKKKSIELLYNSVKNYRMDLKKKESKVN
jgi:hypothetical protein